MTKITVWGPHTWFFLHTMACKVKEDKYEEIKNDVYNIIKSILSNLPCDYCAEHATSILKKININTISTKEKLKMFLFNFHNDVNSRTKKPLSSPDVLNKYTDLNLKHTAEILYKVFHTNDKEHMMNEFTRCRMLKSIQPSIQKLINNSD